LEKSIPLLNETVSQCLGHNVGILGLKNQWHFKTPCHFPPSTKHTAFSPAMRPELMAKPKALALSSLQYISGSNRACNHPVVWV
jgi:hypothetical protein